MYLWNMSFILLLYIVISLTFRGQRESSDCCASARKYMYSLTHTKCLCSSMIMSKAEWKPPALRSTPYTMVLNLFMPMFDEGYTNSHQYFWCLILHSRVNIWINMYGGWEREIKWWWCEYSLQSLHIWFWSAVQVYKKGYRIREPWVYKPILN